MQWLELPLILVLLYLCALHFSIRVPKTPASPSQPSPPPSTHHYGRLSRRVDRFGIDDYGDYLGQEAYSEHLFASIARPDRIILSRRWD